MMQLTHDIRNETLELIRKSTGAAEIASAPGQLALVETWLASLEPEDLTDVSSAALASILWQGFSAVASCKSAACQVVPLRYEDGRGGWATALLIHNPDMPFLVDSIVMALRRQKIVSHAVLNAVLTVRRSESGSIGEVERARTGGDSLESFVLCLMAQELSEEDQSRIADAIRMVAGDAAAVRRDKAAIEERMVAVASIVSKQADQPGMTNDGKEIAAFLEWARNGGFEAFGYAFYHAATETHELKRVLQSRIGVLKNATHPVYDSCLAGIPGEYETLAARTSALSVVKADVESTLHRDQHLDFIGVREKNTVGDIVGEHCFIGLFSRSASLTPLAQLPFVRGRIAKVLEIAGVRKEGFRAEKFLEILESLPRTEVFESEPQFLAHVCSTVVALYKQPRAKVFARRDVYGRHLNLLVYLPRERYSEALTATLATSVRSLSGARDVTVQTLLADGPLARIYLIASHARLNTALDANLELPLLTTIEGWPRSFASLVDAGMVVEQRAQMRKLSASLPADYVEVSSPQTAYRDLTDFLTIKNAPRVKVHVETGLNGEIEIRLLSVSNPPSLSAILPALQNAGVSVDREQTYTIADTDAAFFVTCLTVDAHSATRLAQARVADATQELFEQLLNHEAEDGRMNALVIEAGLRTQEIQVIRAYASYWRQAGCRFSLRYIADCLKKQPAAVRTLVSGFLQRFDPSTTPEKRAEGTASLDALRNDLAHVNHADTEDIIKSVADLMLATLRTSYFQSAQVGDTIILKFDSSSLALLPQPKPYREIFVFSRRFEGVHLRGGPVARGGLRWSDRMEDYRTEVLGLVKAQMVKNAVIVPAGAKGGFVCKFRPVDATRESIAAEGEAVYRLFIAGLLDMTDNRVGDSIVTPAETVCYDEPDPYLVVAADKGTATFSDIANGIAVERGFWLGDAFASGGSNGYDHKKLGITAKGAWEAVKRHFYELGHDLETTPITITGVGDMSGDVFGNGLLLSHQAKLIAAFDHRHIFIDPTPDIATSFTERQRMFALPRSSWEDYDKGLISEGGGVWPRSARTIPLSPQVRTALGTDVLSATPEQLLHLILLAPVDLFYNGGIGTYIKASSETHAAVKDRANDNIRADGNQLRCKVVSEGGNLGATQAGRIEFALCGGRIFTDAIDNSAGVDCSDHEVNVKIWLDTEVNAGTLDAAGRNHILNSFTADIESLVLRDNTLQTHLLAREDQAQSEPDSRHGYAALIARLEAGDVISRKLEQLPDVAELARREAAGFGLTAPELAVVIAHVKNRYKRLLAALPLVSHDWARYLLTPYFPPALVATRDPLDHPLANAILATILANESVNRCGPLMLCDLAERHAVDETDVIIAWARGWAALNLAPTFEVLDANALIIAPEVSKALDRRTRGLQRAVSSGVLSMPVLAPFDTKVVSTEGKLDELTRLFGTPAAAQTWLGDTGKKASGKAETAEPTAFAIASKTVDSIEAIADFLFAALAVQRPVGVTLPAFLQLGIDIRRHSGIDRLERTLMLAAAAPSQQGLRGHALQALRRAQQGLVEQVLQQVSGKAGDDEAVMQCIDSVLHQVPQLPPEGEDDTVDQISLDEAILSAWNLSEAVSGLKLAA